MSRLRILADDLAAALDCAAQFAPLHGPIPAFWGPPPELPWPAAIDASTRELTAAEAGALTSRLAGVLDGADPAFKLLDPLLRGHPAAEIAACLHGFDHCVIATACPTQGCITREGRQLAYDGEDWRPVGPDLRSELAERGIAARLRRPGEAAPDGISLWDGATESALDQIVAEARCLPGRVLWCGSIGLASALAGRAPVPSVALPAPVLALVGSDHQVSVGQLSAVWAQAHRIRRGDPDEAAPIARRLRRHGVAVAVVVPPGMARAEASGHIAACFGRLLGALDPPGTLIIAGGETLRAVCRALAARRVDVDGQVAPGMPTGMLRGGSWDGVRLVAKPGAFGEPGLLAHLLGGATG